jgi:hypothetical protein
MEPSFLASEIFRSYDKTGGKFLVGAVKYRYFGDSSYRMTQKRLETFFENEANFTVF